MVDALKNLYDELRAKKEKPSPERGWRYKENIALKKSSGYLNKQRY
jgi:hypothetical protein